MKISLLLFTFLSFLFISCERDGSGNCTETNISTSNRSSHKTGEDCLACHSSGKHGRGCFDVCGSAFKSNKTSPMQNAVFVLFTRDSITNKLINVSKSIPLDKSGSFYSTDFKISYVNKYAAIICNGDTSEMSIPLKLGDLSCNRCHSKTGSHEPIYSQH